MDIRPITSYKNIFNFCSNIRFFPIRNMNDVEEAAKLYSADTYNATIGRKEPAVEFQPLDTYKYSNGIIPREVKVLIFISKMLAKLTNTLTDAMDVELYNAWFESKKSAFKSHLWMCKEFPNYTNQIEVAEKDKKIIGAYSLWCSPNDDTAYINGIVTAPSIRKGKTSKEFLLAVADRIYDKVSSDNVRYICWKENIANPNMRNLYRKRFKDKNDRLKVSVGNMFKTDKCYVVNIDDFKKSIDEYKRTH